MKRNQGSALLFVIITMVIMAVLGAGMVSLVRTDAMQNVRANYGQRAYYMAESGFRYATSVYMESGNPDDIFNDNYNERVFNVPEGGSFALTIFNVLEERDENGDLIYNTNFTIDSDQMVSKGGDISIDLPESGRSLPAINGVFKYNGVKYRYRNYDDSSHKLINVIGIDENESFPLVFEKDQAYTLEPIARITSKGSYPGNGPLNVDRTITFIWPLSGKDGGESLKNIFTDHTGIAGIPFNDLDEFSDLFEYDSEGDTKFTVEEVETQWGMDSGLMVDDLEYDYYDPDSKLWMGDEIILLNSDVFGPAFQTEWQDKNRLFEYDVQVKMKWGWGELYGATGIVFRWHPKANNKHEGYGISLMRYRGSAKDDIRMDRLPNLIKPYPARWAELLDDWFGDWHWFWGWENEISMRGLDKSNDYKNLHTLLVLWHQDVKGGKEYREWIAYKDLGVVTYVVDNYGNAEKRTLDWYLRPNGLELGNYQYDRYILGLQPDWDYDGIYINDMSTLGVRVEESKYDGKKVNKVKVFYADASTYYTARSTSDIIPYNIEYLRSHRYLPSQFLLDEESAYHTGEWPLWPPEDIDAWTHSDDRFTVIGRSPSNNYLKWDAVKADQSLVEWDDPCTLILKKHTSPDNLNQWGNRNEVGIHVFGNFNNDGIISSNEDNEYAVFDDFSMRFINTNSGDKGQFIPAMQK